MTKNDNIRKEVHKMLTSYLQSTNRRKTEERYAILDAIYSMSGSFTLDELNQKLIDHYFSVSKATLYNNIRLFLGLRLIICHHLQDGIRYEACYSATSHCYQICTCCGKVSELNEKDFEMAINKMRTQRFRKSSYVLYLYGICSSCAYRQSHPQTNKTIKNKTI